MGLVLGREDHVCSTSDWRVLGCRVGVSIACSLSYPSVSAYSTRRCESWPGRYVKGNETGRVRCWDPEGNRVAFDIEGGHGFRVIIVIAYHSSASGTTRLLTASIEGRAKVWETANDSGALVLTLENGLRTDEDDYEHTIRHACVFCGPTGSDRMAIGYASGTIRVWDAEAVRADDVGRW
jgi:WD40 repeat protein